MPNPGDSLKSEFAFGIGRVARAAKISVGKARLQRTGKSAVAAGVDGVHPAHQDRSRAKQDALITSGIRMLSERDYNSLSIAELTAANGVSVGAFYARFSGKDAFFNALQQQVFADVAARARDRYAPDAWAVADARAVLDDFIAFFLGLVRRHRGVIFAAMQHEAAHPAAWTPVRKSGAAIAAPFASVIAPKLGHIPAAQRAGRIGFAVQVLYGTLINAVLHDPGPIKLADARLQREMQQVLASYLGLSKEGSRRRSA
jgi:AcrR family transcriptional regulator